MRGWVCLAVAWVCANAQTPAAKPQFEVASVKPAAPAAGPAGEIMARVMRNQFPVALLPGDAARVRIQNWTLLDLIVNAWHVRPIEVAGPAWLSDQGWDIDAKIPEGLPRSQAQEMLQALLEERFGLKTHRESRSESGYALVVGKNGPKLKESDDAPDPLMDLSPEERQARRKEGAIAAMKRMQEAMKNGDFRGGSRSTWRGITTEQLAVHLTRLAEKPVMDMTGLTGKYDVTIETSQDLPDNPGISVFDAVEKLGLKLEPRKVTVDTVVVDQVSKTPTAN